MRNRNYQTFGPVDFNSGLLRVSLDGAILDDLKSPEKVRPNVSGLDELRRLKTVIYNKVDSNIYTRLGSFCGAYQMIVSCLIKMKQTNILHTIRGIFNTICKSSYSNNVQQDHMDDYIRQKMKKLSSWALERVSQNPGYMFLMHLHQLGGRAPYTEQQIYDDIDSWVGEVKGKIDDNRDYILDRLDHYMNTWPRHDSNMEHLSFGSFCYDLQRWATSGGAPKVEYENEKYRTKWMWGFVNGKYDTLTPKDMSSFEERGLKMYSVALKSGNVCNVALKEEAAKTREIITTPMASYLRQSYLLYRWGKPRHLDSPIASSAWLSKFNSTLYSWYGAIDGDRFDHTVPNGL